MTGADVESFGAADERVPWRCRRPTHSWHWNEWVLDWAAVHQRRKACLSRRGMGSRNSRCRLPGFEVDLSEPCVSHWKQRCLAEFRSRVACVWVGDDIAGILQRSQSPPHQFIHPKLFRPCNFDHAIYRLTCCNLRQHHLRRRQRPLVGKARAADAPCFPPWKYQRAP